MIIEPYEGNSSSTYNSNLNAVDLNTQSTVVTSSLIVTGSAADVVTDYSQRNTMTQSVDSLVRSSYDSTKSNSSSSLGYIANSTKKVLPANYVPPAVPIELQERATQPVYQYSSATQPATPTSTNNYTIVILLGALLFVLIILLVIIFFI